MTKLRVAFRDFVNAPKNFTEISPGKKGCTSTLSRLFIFGFTRRNFNSTDVGNTIE